MLLTFFMITLHLFNSLMMLLRQHLEVVLHLLMLLLHLHEKAFPLVSTRFLVFLKDLLQLVVFFLHLDDLALERFNLLQLRQLYDPLVLGKHVWLVMGSERLILIRCWAPGGGASVFENSSDFRVPCASLYFCYFFDVKYSLIVKENHLF